MRQDMRYWAMEAIAQQVCVVLSTAEREQLVAIVADPNRSRKHVERARIVLASADRHSAHQVAHRIGVSRLTGGGGSNASPRAGSTVCRVTRPASPARRRSQRKPRLGWGP
jgi:hypothetical protein